MSRKPVRPFPSFRPVETYPHDTFRLTDTSRPLFDSVASEHTRRVGTAVEFFSQDAQGKERDAVYDEPISGRWKGPFRVHAYVEWPDSSPSAGQEGLKTEYNGSLWLARVDLEQVLAPDPNEGDVVRIWRLPFYDQKWSTAGVENISRSGYYFDIMDVDDDGHLFDTPSFMGFKCMIQRRTEFTPERRMER